MADQTDTRQCPLCKEDIKADAIKCKYCGSRIEPTKPAHGGTCPYCKETINPEAILCRHCRSVVGGQGAGDCGCDGPRSTFGSGPTRGAFLSPEVAARMSQATNRMGTQRWPLQCSSFCSGPTLYCVCTLPGTDWISIFPCGSCIDDPGSILA